MSETGANIPATHDVNNQLVERSVVFGDVIQVLGVGGNVTIATDRPPYRVMESQSSLMALTIERALRQPSRMLLARHGIVPFVGRNDERAELLRWLSGDEIVSAQLVHGPGGQGKTRLAMSIADQCTEDGWRVWWAQQTDGSGSKLRLPAKEAGLLVVVDYADRWLGSHLIGLVRNLTAVAERSSTRVRVLFLARSIGFWWHAVADSIDSQFGVESDTWALTPLGQHVSRLELFVSAREQFALKINLAAADITEPPLPDLSGKEHAQVLSIHMAALVSVDAQRQNITAPSGAEAISAYLLRREFNYWQALHRSSESAIATGPALMRRVVYVATIAGALTRTDGQAVLARAELATTQDAANVAIDDHRLCYPPEAPHSVLEPLRPERLGEDFIAISTPGHTVKDFEADDWSIEAPGRLLGDRTGEIAPSWAPAVLTSIVETAYRWPHVAEQALFPMLRLDPTLAFRAGGTTLSRIAGLPNVDLDLLDLIAVQAPKREIADLDVGLAAVSERLLERSLGAARSDDARASILDDYARRLASAGLRTKALSVKRQVVGIDRALYKKNQIEYGPKFVASLSGLAEELSELGQSSDAFLLKREAISIAERLSAAPAVLRKRLLAMAVGNLGIEHSKQGMRHEAVKTTQRAVRIHRGLVSATKSVDDWRGLASCLGNLSIELSSVGRHDDALNAAVESQEVQQKIAGIDGRASLPELARAADNLSRAYSNLGLDEEAAKAAEEAARICKELANINPGKFEARLASTLDNLGLRYEQLGRHDDALAVTLESVEIYDRLAARDWQAFSFDLAIALNNLGTFMRSKGRLGDSVESIERAIEAYRGLTQGSRATVRSRLASSLQNLAISLHDLGSWVRGARAAEEALLIRRSLVEKGAGSSEAEVEESLDLYATHLRQADEQRDVGDPRTQ